MSQISLTPSPVRALRLKATRIPPTPPSGHDVTARFAWALEVCQTTREVVLMKNAKGRLRRGSIVPVRDRVMATARLIDAAGWRPTFTEIGDACDIAHSIVIEAVQRHEKRVAGGAA